MPAKCILASRWHFRYWLGMRSLDYKRQITRFVSRTAKELQVDLKAS